MVIIGSGAGGGTLAHELTRRGIKVVLLEAGGRQSPATLSQNPGEAFGQLTWLEPRTQSGNWGQRASYPDAAGLALQDGRRHDGALDRRDAAAAVLRDQGAHHLRRRRRHLAHRLADRLRAS